MGPDACLRDSRSPVKDRHPWVEGDCLPVGFRSTAGSESSPRAQEPESRRGRSLSFNTHGAPVPGVRPHERRSFHGSLCPGCIHHSRACEPRDLEHWRPVRLARGPALRDGGHGGLHAAAGAAGPGAVRGPGALALLDGSPPPGRSRLHRLHGLAAGGEPERVWRFAAVYFVVCLGSMACWAWTGTLLRGALGNPSRVRLFNRGMAALLTGCAFSLLLA